MTDTGNSTLLAKILDTPHLSHAVQQLPPELLHAVIRHCGLEDASPIVAMATPAQIAAVFDIDLWRSAQAGGEEQFDAERFGVWLEVLLDAGAESAARMLASLDHHIVVSALAQYLRVFDPATLAIMIDDEIIERQFATEVTTEIGGFVLVARRPDAWDAIVEILAELATSDPAAFQRLMHGCRALSDDDREMDGLDDLLGAGDQAMHDRAVEREQRREARGYVTPAHARAFLTLARTSEEPIPLFAVAADESDASSAPGAPGAPEAPEAPLAPLIDLLTVSGVVPQPPRALLTGEGTSAPVFSYVTALLEAAASESTQAFAERAGELAHLANVLVAGCPLHGRAFTPQEASDAVLAICNLGLESDSKEPGRATGSLVVGFQKGWKRLHEEVCIEAARRLLAVLRDIRCTDRDLQSDLRTLQRELRRHLTAGQPWLAKPHFDVLTALDLPSWAALLAFVAECPTLHASVTAKGRVLSVNPHDFTFISERAHIARAMEFLSTLTDRLTS